MIVDTQANRVPIGKCWRYMPGRLQSRGAWQLRRPSGCLALGLLLLLSLPALSPAQQLQPWQVSPLAPSGQLLDPSTVKTGPLAKLGGTLRRLYQEYEEHRSRSAAPFVSRIPLVQVQEETVTIDAVANTEANELLTKLEALGLQNGVSFGAMVSGQLPISALLAVAALAELRFVRPAMATTNVGSVTSQGDPAQRSDDARTTFGIDGTGITVGTLSDSYDCLGGAAADVGTGDLPAGITVLMELASCGSGTDEGRAMMQLIADVAPGADQAFHTAFGGMADFALGIERLAGCPPGSSASCTPAPGVAADVIVDDVIYPTEPMFQDGVVAQAVDTVTGAGVAYFSSAGNNSRKSYESPSGFIASAGVGPSGGPLHDFDPTATDDPFQNITIPVGSGITISFQWDSPFASVCPGCPGSPNDMDIFLTGDGAGILTPVAGSIDSNIGGDAVEVFNFTNPGTIDIDGIAGADTTFNLAFELVSGSAPGHLKYVRRDAGPGVTVSQFDTASSTLYGHANAAGAEAVGAAFYFRTPPFGTSPPLLEPFSSAGPTDILFDTMGMLTMELRDKPEIVAPDWTNTTFFGSDIPDPGDGSDLDSFPNFRGTSAAAPHAAGVAVLLRQQTNLTPSGVYQVLEASATDMGPAGFDYDSGYGLINALKAAQSTAPVSASCGVDDLVLTGTPNVGTQTFRACKTVTAGDGVFNDLTLIAGNGTPGTVTFQAGFTSAGPLTVIAGP